MPRSPSSPRNETTRLRAPPRGAPTVANAAARDASNGASDDRGLIAAIEQLRAEVAALRQDVAALGAPQGGLRQQLLTTLAERFAALAEIQRELIEAELDAFRALAIAPDRVAPAVEPMAGRRTKGS
jgi:hypothetical protein